MKRKQKYWVLFGIVFLCGLLISVPASANAPAPPSVFYYEVTNPPAEAAFVDLLLQVDTADEGYTAFSKEDEWSSKIPEAAPIVAYAEEGYQSMRFHQTEFHGWGEVESGGFSGSRSAVSLNELAPSVKLALVDREGKLLVISEAVSLTPPDEDQFPRQIRFDAQTGEVAVDFSHYYKGSGVDNGLELPLLALILIRMALSVLIETLIALPFALRPLWKIAAVNGVTQILLVLFMTLGGLPYNLALVIGEIVVFAAEFAAFCLLYRQQSKKRLALFTLCANTVTLLIGLLLNQLRV